MSKIVIIFVFVITCVSIGFCEDICNEMKGYLILREAFLVNNTLFLILQNGKVYKSTFSYDKTKNEFKTSTPVNIDVWGKKWTKRVKLMFPYNYPGQGLIVIAIELDKRHSIEQMVGYLIKFNTISGEFVDKKEFNVNLYRYVPKEDPINLKSLFVKMPQDNLVDHLTSLSSFPSYKGLPERLFVYYKETPTKSKGTECEGCYHSKRYIYVKEDLTTGDWTEANWVLDKVSGKGCFNLNGIIINASTPLSEMRKEGNTYSFEWIEFFGNQYRVFKVSLNDKLVLNETNVNPSVKNGSINSLFGCKEGNPNDAEEELDESTGNKTDENTTSAGDKPIKPTGGEESGPSFWSIIFIIILILLIICAVVALIYLLVLKKPPEDANSANTQSAPPPPSGTPQPSTPPVKTAEPVSTPENAPPGQSNPSTGTSAL